MKVYGMILVLALGLWNSVLAGFIDADLFLWVPDNDAIFERYAVLDPEGMFDARLVEVDYAGFLDTALVDLFELDHLLARLSEIVADLAQGPGIIQQQLLIWQRAYIIHRIQSVSRQLSFYRDQGFLEDRRLLVFLNGAFGLQAWDSLWADNNAELSIIAVNRLRYHLGVCLSEQNHAGAHVRAMAQERAQNAVQLALSSESPSLAAEHYRLASYFYQFLNPIENAPKPFAEQIVHWTNRALIAFEDIYSPPIDLGGPSDHLPSYVDFNEAVIITEFRAENGSRRPFFRIRLGNHNAATLNQFADVCIQRANDGMSAGNYWLAHIYFLCAIYLKHQDASLLAYIESMGSDEHNAAFVNLLDQAASEAFVLAPDEWELLLSACTMLRADALVSRASFDERLLGVLAVYVQSADFMTQQAVLSRLAGILHSSIKMDPVLRSAYASMLIAMLNKNVLPANNSINLRQQAIEVLHIYFDQHFVNAKTRRDGPFVGNPTMLYIPRLIGQFAEAGFLAPAQVKDFLNKLHSILGIQGFRKKYKDTFGEEQVYLTIADALDALGEIVAVYFDDIEDSMLPGSMFPIYGYIGSDNEHATPAVAAAHRALRRIGIVTYGRMASRYNPYAMHRTWEDDWTRLIVGKQLISPEEEEILKQDGVVAL